MSAQQTQGTEGGAALGVGQTTTISKVKSQFPELRSLSDGQIVNVMHSQYYPDRPRAEVAKALGVTSAEIPANIPDSPRSALPSVDQPRAAKAATLEPASAIASAERGGAATTNPDPGLDWGAVGGWILIACAIVGTHSLFRVLANRSVQEAKKMALAPVVRHPFATGLAAALLASLLGVAYWVGKPWDKDQCITEATNKPTDRGVRLAEMQCYAQFGK